MENNPFQFPITGWEIKSGPVDGLLSVRFPFLSHGQQNLAEADPGRPYIMQVEQAREFRDALSRALERIENQALESSLPAVSASSLSIY
jgi:hypothetical protein